MKKIEVFGVGCYNCKRAEEELRKFLKAKGWVEGKDYTLEKISNPGEIASRGVISTPGIAVDGKIVSKGKIPWHDEMESWLA